MVVRWALPRAVALGILGIVHRVHWALGPTFRENVTRHCLHCKNVYRQAEAMSSNARNALQCSVLGNAWEWLAMLSINIQHHEALFRVMLSIAIASPLRGCLMTHEHELSLSRDYGYIGTPSDMLSKCRARAIPGKMRCCVD